MKVVSNMTWYKHTIQIDTHGKGLYSFTSVVSAKIHEWGIREGMCFLYIQHTSASLVVGENYDPTARQDMETFLNRLIPDNQTWFAHNLEGPDDSTAHLRALITPTSQTIPIDDGELSLGMWQGIFLFEHRAIPHRRQVLLRALSMD